MLTTTSTIPPPIAQYFSKLLLWVATPKLKDDEEDILNILHYLKSELWKKLEKCPGKKLKCEKLYKYILEMYESIKKQKENREAKTTFTTELPFYYFDCARRSHGQILQRHKYKARTFSRSRANNAVS
jgi:hypothetical protein